jgi:hypothetical protein
MAKFSTGILASRRNRVIAVVSVIAASILVVGDRVSGSMMSCPNIVMKSSIIEEKGFVTNVEHWKPNNYYPGTYDFVLRPGTTAYITIRYVSATTILMNPAPDAVLPNVHNATVDVITNFYRMTPLEYFNSTSPGLHRIDAFGNMVYVPDLPEHEQYTGFASAIFRAMFRT